MSAGPGLEAGTETEAQLVLVCGGRGRRLGTPAQNIPKSMVPVGGKPLLERLVGAVGGLHRSTSPPLVIVDHGDTCISALAHRSFPSVIVVRQPLPDGVASALSLTLPHLVGDALVVLGDIVLDGFFKTPWPKAPAVGVWRNAPGVATEKNFGVSMDQGRIGSFVEKPTHAPGLLCGMGVYLLPKPMIEDFRRAPVNPTSGEREITAALEDVRSRGASFECMDFNGFYWNVNSDVDRRLVERHFADVIDEGGTFPGSTCAPGNQIDLASGETA